MKGSEKANIMKSSEAIPEMDSPPPSHPGRNGLIAHATHMAAAPNTDVAAKACLRTSLAILNSPAPIRCATCTLNPTEAAERMPPNSQVLVDMSPIAADASAPRLPTMEASIYTITIYESWASMEGILSRTIKASRCLHDNDLPLRTISSNIASVFIYYLNRSALLLPDRGGKFNEFFNRLSGFNLLSLGH